MDEQKRILIVGAHHEEIEAECPNIAALLASAGCEVVILNPVGGWNWTFIRSLGAEGRERTIADATAAAAELGCRKVIWDFPVAQLGYMEDALCMKMAEFLLDFAPHIVLMHWPLDAHADHRAVARVTRHILSTAANISEKTHPDFQAPLEVYAFQTGVAQAYGFIPDLFVRTDAESMRRSDRAVECFINTAPDRVPVWRANFHSKAEYWGNTAGAPAEALKFLGPMLPLNGFLLKEILGDKLISAPLESFFYNREFA